MRNSTFNVFKIKPKTKVLVYDLLLITIMAVLAACGLIYQYLLSHYAGRVLGMMEHAIFTMIGVMIVSMGIGSFLAKTVSCAFTGFAWLEAIIAFFGGTGILVIGAMFAFSFIFPEMIGSNFSMPPDLVPMGGFVQTVQQLAGITPYIIGFIIGLFIGMEIPFIARVREHIYGEHLAHNVGTIYGSDYIGAGIGAAIFIMFMLNQPPEEAAVYTAAVNLLAGLVFLFMFRKRIRWSALLLTSHALLAVMLVVLYNHAAHWNQSFEDALYKDKVIYSLNTEFQHITLTKRMISPEYKPVYALYLNGRTQFNSSDERIYHDMLVHPVLLASARQKNILIIGGGDGLALREVLKWRPDKVTLLELDREMIRLFSEPVLVDGKQVNKPLLALNKNSFSNSSVHVIYGDAFNSVDALIGENQRYDAIIVDLPDPSNPNLNKLYTTSYYTKLYHLLAGDGAIVIQSTSPYHAKAAFLTVGVSLKASGFKHVSRFHQNVPSFGEWGWTIATVHGLSPEARIADMSGAMPEDTWASKPLILGSFHFGKGFFLSEVNIKPNRLGTQTMYQLHQQAWMQEQGMMEKKTTE
ncbi:MAG: polyamine aminopropyltransferase [Mariprofundaceae bacterium]|nr:polyamine aminopropyltransferase [Mariprofundaceae bacterium]